MPKLIVGILRHPKPDDPFDFDDLPNTAEMKPPSDQTLDEYATEQLLLSIEIVEPGLLDEW